MKASQTILKLAQLVADLLPAGMGRDAKPDHEGTTARRIHTSQTISQLAGWLPDTLEINLAELSVAFESAGYRRGLDPAQRARQLTCMRLAELCRMADGDVPISGLRQALERGIAVWLAWYYWCDISDPRQKAMKATFNRELAALWVEHRALTALEGEG